MLTQIAIEPPSWPLQRFEKALLVDEASMLCGTRARWRDGQLWVDGCLGDEELRRLRARLAFAHAVAGTPTAQHTLEQASSATRRKVTSHALHGLHPYKGKFYPQLARSLINVCDVRDGGSLLDPFAGCGTSVLEARLLGLRGVGIDANPLAVLVSRTKLELLAASPRRIGADFERVQRWRGQPAEHPDHAYLERWFPPHNLAELNRLLAAIRELRSRPSRNGALVVLSSVLREASFQDPRQMRVHRRSDGDRIPPLELLFTKAAERLVSEVSAIRSTRLIEATRADTCHVVEGDARELGLLGKPFAPFDAVITSPPYATALPYLDTDRLSLRAFGLLAGSPRQAEDRLIGNREINTSTQRELEDEIKDASWLPGRLSVLIRRTLDVADEPTAGFRKKRTPALLYRYFRDMRIVLAELPTVTAPGAPVVIVIGDNTVAGPRGTTLRVPTADLLEELAAESGLELHKRLRKRLTSFGAKDTVHQRNAMDGEEILFFRRAR